MRHYKLTIQSVDITYGSNRRRITGVPTNEMESNLEVLETCNIPAARPVDGAAADLRPQIGKSHVEVPKKSSSVSSASSVDGARDSNNRLAQAKQNLVEIRSQQASARRRATEPGKRHHVLHHSLSDSAILLDPWRDGAWDKDGDGPLVEEQMREELRLSKLHQSLSERGGLASPRYADSTDTDDAASSDSTSGDGSACSAGSAFPLSPARRKAHMESALSQALPHPHTAARRHGRLHHAFSDSALVFASFRMKSAGWLKHVSKHWADKARAKRGQHAVSKQVGYDVSAIMIQAHWRGARVRIDARGPDTGRLAQRNLKRRVVRTTTPDCDGDVTPTEVFDVPRRQSPGSSYKDTLDVYGEACQSSLDSSTLDLSPSHSRAERFKQQLDNHNRKLSGLGMEPVSKGATCLEPALELTPIHSPPGVRSDESSEVSPVANLSFAFVTSGEQIELLMADDESQAASIHEQLRIQRVGTSPASPQLSDSWQQAWAKDVEKTEEARRERQSPKHRAPPKKMKKPARRTSLENMPVVASEPEMEPRVPDGSVPAE
jgi:hypothetical protein